MSLILQERAQLEALYGRLDAQTIYSGGCGHKLFFGGLDPASCHALEQALGQNTVYDTYYEGVSEHARVVGVPLLRAGASPGGADRTGDFSARRRWAPRQAARNPLRRNRQEACRGQAEASNGLNELALICDSV